MMVLQHQHGTDQYHPGWMMPRPAPTSVVATTTATAGTALAFPQWYHCMSDSGHPSHAASSVSGLALLSTVNNHSPDLASPLSSSSHPLSPRGFDERPAGRLLREMELSSTAQEDYLSASCARKRDVSLLPWQSPSSGYNSQRSSRVPLPCSTASVSSQENPQRTSVISSMSRGASRPCPYSSDTAMSSPPSPKSSCFFAGAVQRPVRPSGQTVTDAGTTSLHLPSTPSTVSSSLSGCAHVSESRVSEQCVSGSPKPLRGFPLSQPSYSSSPPSCRFAVTASLSESEHHYHHHHLNPNHPHHNNSSHGRRLELTNPHDSRFASSYSAWRNSLHPQSQYLRRLVSENNRLSVWPSQPGQGWCLPDSSSPSTTPHQPRNLSSARSSSSSTVSGSSAQPPCGRSMPQTVTPHFPGSASFSSNFNQSDSKEWTSCRFQNNRSPASPCGANFQGMNFQGTNFQGTDFKATNSQGRYFPSEDKRWSSRTRGAGRNWTSGGSLRTLPPSEAFGGLSGARFPVTWPRMPSTAAAFLPPSQTSSLGSRGWKGLRGASGGCVDPDVDLSALAAVQALMKMRGRVGRLMIL
ncbi:hypothetical protein ACOMHN_040019 [Nucella lapillus]